MKFYKVINQSGPRLAGEVHSEQAVNGDYWLRIADLAECDSPEPAKPAKKAVPPAAPPAEAGK